MKNRVLDKVVLILRVVIACVFLYAGWQKVRAPQQFADSIAAYQLLPSQLIDPVAIGLPPLELMIGCLLLIGWQRRIAAFSALVLSLVFMAALISAISRGLTIDCGCFGSNGPLERNLWVAVFQDLFMAGILIVIYSRDIGAARRETPVVSSRQTILIESKDF